MFSRRARATRSRPVAGFTKPTVHDILTGSTADGRVMAGRRATIGHRRLQTNRLRWVTPMAWDPAAIRPGDMPYGTRHMRMAAVPIQLRAEEPAGFIASRRNEPGDARERTGARFMA